jgi:hypothetical protein
MYLWTTSHFAAWVFYLTGALATLAWKLFRYCRHGWNMGKPSRELLKEWFFESSTENAVSWITTIAFVWFIGVYYIGGIDFKIAPVLKGIPVHISFAFLLGSIMEFAAPAAAKWLLSKLPGGSLP